MSEALKWCKANWACSEAQEWIEQEGIQTMNEAWAKCDRGDWMLWALAHAKLPIKTKAHLRRFLCDFVKEIAVARKHTEGFLKVLSCIRQGKRLSYELSLHLYAVDSDDDIYDLGTDLKNLDPSFSSSFAYGVKGISALLADLSPTPDLEKLSAQIRQNFQPRDLVPQP